MIQTQTTPLSRGLIAMNRQVSMCCLSMGDSMMAATRAIEHPEGNTTHQRFPDAQTDS